MANSLPLQGAADKLIQVFRADPSLSSHVREVVQAFCERHAVDATRCNHAQVIADELYMNAVKYGSARESDLIFLGIEKGNGTLSISVEDRGAKTEVTPEKLRALIALHRMQQEATDTAGRGLSMIVMGWSQDVRIEHSPLGGLKVVSVISLS